MTRANLASALVLVCSAAAGAFWLSHFFAHGRPWYDLVVLLILVAADSFYAGVMYALRATR